jgi:hypothetical protein
MPIDPHPPDSLSFIAEAAHAYASLMQYAAPGQDSLGGKLLYAGELHQAGRALVIAANIAGAATLAASSNPGTLRQATRTGAIDFLVNSLDEALRILKNEIRKCEPVSVAVSLEPEIIAQEMLDRGVLPNLLPPQSPSKPAAPDIAAFIAQGAQPIAAPSSQPAKKLLIWQIPNEFAQRPAAFDALLQAHVPQDDHSTRRWLRQSPRYLGPQARRLRSLPCDEETAIQLIHDFGQPLNTGHPLNL